MRCGVFRWPDLRVVRTVCRGKVLGGPRRLKLCRMRCGFVFGFRLELLRKLRDGDVPGAERELGVVQAVRHGHIRCLPRNEELLCLRGREVSASSRECQLQRMRSGPILEHPRLFGMRQLRGRDVLQLWGHSMLKVLARNLRCNHRFEELRRLRCGSISACCWFEELSYLWGRQVRWDHGLVDVRGLSRWPVFRGHRCCEMRGMRRRQVLGLWILLLPQLCRRHLRGRQWLQQLLEVRGW